MTYVGCETARDLLEGLVDGELSMADQLAVESHLRWCRTCALRVEDLRLIGASIRRASADSGSGWHRNDVLVGALNEAVLERVRAEREQSLPVRVREMFTDMRFLWPAVGATAAVALWITVAAGVLQASSENPDSLAAMIDMLATPGSERYPLRPANNGITIPRLYEDDAMRAVGTLDQLPDDDVILTIRTIVGRDGRMSNFEVLLADGESGGRAESARHADRSRAVIDAMQQSRFAPAYTPLGRPVAVDVVWVIAKTTAVIGPPVVSTAKSPAKDAAKPETVEPATLPVQPDQQSAAAADSTTA